MIIKHLRTIGDGFSLNYCWPMWSQLLAEILDCEWKNFSLPGMGNEAIAGTVMDQLDSENTSNTLWVIQWALPDRVDFRIDNKKPDFLTQIESDPIYYKNFITTAKGRRYWCSGSSILPWVVSHRLILDYTQHQDRRKLFEQAALRALENSQAQWIFISTQDMMDFLPNSKYKDLDVGEIQPVSSVHLEYLEQRVLPGLPFDTDRLLKIREKTLQTDQERKRNGSYVPWDRNMHERT